MLTGAQPKFEASVVDGKLVLDEPVKNWKLVRERDNLTKYSSKIKWLEWNEDKTFKNKFDEIAIDRSLIMSPFNEFFTWMTTEVTEILVNEKDYIKFKTKKSNYELFKIK